MAKKFLLEDLPDPGLQLRLLAHSMVFGVVDANDGRGQKYVVTQLAACAAPGWGLQEATETSCSNRRKLRPDKENGQLHILGSAQPSFKPGGFGLYQGPESHSWSAVVF